MVFCKICLVSCTLKHDSCSIACPWDSESNKICLLRGVKESNWVLDVSSSTPANSLRLQMRGSDDVDGGQIPLIKNTMAENTATLACLYWGTPTLPLLKETWRGKVNSTELCDTSTGVILLSIVQLQDSGLYIYVSNMTMLQRCFVLLLLYITFLLHIKNCRLHFLCLSKCAGDLCSSHLSIKSKSWEILPSGETFLQFLIQAPVFQIHIHVMWQNKSNYDDNRSLGGGDV